MKFESKSYFLDQLAMLLGGYVTEKLILGETTTGPSSDLERATHMARNIVTRYGMSELGARTFGKNNDLVFLGKDSTEERDYSDKTAEQIDRVVSEFIENARKIARDIITERRPILDKIADTLLEKETIEKDEFNCIMEGKEYIPEVKVEKVKESEEKDEESEDVK